MNRPALGLIETAGLTGAIQATHAATKAGDVAIASAERIEPGHVVVKIEGEWEAVQSAVEAGARAADEAGELIAMHLIPRTDNGVLNFLPYRQFMARYVPESSVAPVLPKPDPKPAPKPRAKPKPRPKPSVAAEPRPDPASETPPAPEPKPESKAEPATVQPTPGPPFVVKDDREETPPARSVDPDRRPESEPAPAAEGEPSMEELASLPVVKLRRYARTVKGLPIQGRQISMANKEKLLEAIQSVRNAS